MRYLFVLLLPLALLVACGQSGQQPKDDTATLKPLAAGAGGSGMQFVCSGGKCECDNTPDASEGMSCDGIREFCKSQGETLTCKYGPDPTCSCPHPPTAVTSSIAASSIAATAGSSRLAISRGIFEGTGFICTPENCRCNPDTTDPTLPSTCKGMDKACEHRGQIPECKWPPTGRPSCTCVDA
jgi:hypothetical protein